MSAPRLERYDRVRTSRTGTDWLLVRAVSATTATLVDADGNAVTVPLAAILWNEQ